MNYNNTLLELKFVRKLSKDGLTISDHDVDEVCHRKFHDRRYGVESPSNPADQFIPVSRQVNRLHFELEMLVFHDSGIVRCLKY